MSCLFHFMFTIELEGVQLFWLVESPSLDSRVLVDSRVQESRFSALKRAINCQNRANPSGYKTRKCPHKGETWPSKSRGTWQTCLARVFTRLGPSGAHNSGPRGVKMRARGSFHYFLLIWQFSVLIRQFSGESHESFEVDSDSRVWPGPASPWTRES